MNISDYLTPGEAAKTIGCSASTLKRWRQSGRDCGQLQIDVFGQTQWVYHRDAVERLREDYQQRKESGTLHHSGSTATRQVFNKPVSQRRHKSPLRLEPGSGTALVLPSFSPEPYDVLAPLREAQRLHQELAARELVTR